MPRWLHMEHFKRRTDFKLNGPPATPATSGKGLFHPSPPKMIPIVSNILVSNIFTLPVSLNNHSDKVIQFLVDTGSAVSVLPLSYRTEPTAYDTTYLQAANGSAIKSTGYKTLQFSIKNFRETFSWRFIVADVSQPILGADFLSHYKLLVDCANKTIIKITDFHRSDSHNTEALVFTPIYNIQQGTSMVTNLSENLTAELKNFITHKCHNTIKKDTSFKTLVTTKHYIITSNTAPLRQKRRELAPEKRAAAEKEFLELEKSGIVRRSTSPWASPLHLVLKKDGSVRPCGDYRQVNNVTQHDSYPLPLITDILHRLEGSKIFSTIDLRKAYHQIPVADIDVPKTAVTTPFGLFEYLYMPFGLRNAAQTFQRHIDIVLSNLPFAFPYIDDILIASKDEQQHVQHLKIIFSKLHQHNLQVNWEKCRFLSASVKFLGHLISNKGHSPLPERLLAIKNISLPNTVTELRSFLGTINFCHRYIPNCSQLTAKLSSISSGPKRSKIHWTEDTRLEFEALKNKLQQLHTLAYPISSAPLFLTTDASTIAAGAVLHQLIDNQHQPIEFFSVKFSSA